MHWQPHIAALLAGSLLGIAAFLSGSEVAERFAAFPPEESLKALSAQGITSVREDSYYSRGTHLRLKILTSDRGELSYPAWYPRYQEVREALLGGTPVTLQTGRFGKGSSIFEVSSGRATIASYAEICRAHLRNWRAGVAAAALIVGLTTHYFVLRSLRGCTKPAA